MKTNNIGQLFVITSNSNPTDNFPPLPWYNGNVHVGGALVLARDRHNKMCRVTVVTDRSLR